MSKFNYFLPGGIRQRSTINKHTTKLVYATVTYMETKASESSHRLITAVKTHVMKQKKKKKCFVFLSLDGEEDGRSVKDGT